MPPQIRRSDDYCVFTMSRCLSRCPVPDPQEFLRSADWHGNLRTRILLQKA